MERGGRGIERDKWNKSDWERRSEEREVKEGDSER